jgi:hypothetical protein
MSTIDLPNRLRSLHESNRESITNIHTRLQSLGQQMKNVNKEIKQLFKERQTAFDAASSADKSTVVKEYKERIAKSEEKRKAYKQELDVLKAKISALSTRKNKASSTKRPKTNNNTRNSKYVHFTENEIEKTVKNMFGRRLTEKNEVYSLTRAADYRIKKLEPASDARGRNSVTVYDYNQSDETEIESKLNSENVIKLDERGKKEVARIAHIRKILRPGLLVEYNNIYYFINIITPATPGSINVRNILKITELPPANSTAEQIEQWKPTKSVFVKDSEIRLVSKDEIAKLKNVIDLLNSKHEKNVNAGFPEITAEEAAAPAEEAAAPAEEAVAPAEEAAAPAEEAAAPAEEAAAPAEEAAAPAEEAAAPAEEAAAPAEEAAAPAEEAAAPAEEAAAPAEEAAAPAEEAAAPAEEAAAPADETNTASTIVGGIATSTKLLLPSEVNLQHLTMEKYKALPKKDIPVIIDSTSTPTQIQVMNGYACEKILDTLGKLEKEEKQLYKYLFIEPSHVFQSIDDILPEQICFIIVFNQLLFISASTTNDSKINIGASFRDKYKIVNDLLNKPLDDDNSTILEELWTHVQEKYIKQKERFIEFETIKSFIISGPQYLQKYFEEAMRIHKGEKIAKRFFQNEPVISSSATVLPAPPMEQMSNANSAITVTENPNN